MENEEDFIDYKVKYPKIRRLIYLIAGFWIAFIICSIFLCRNADAGPKAEIRVDKILKISDTKKTNVLFFGELSSFYAVPDGYEVAAIGEFKNTIVTARCNFDVLMERSKKKCKELNYDGYALVDLKQPSLWNTCYQSKVIFLIALKR